VPEEPEPTRSRLLETLRREGPGTVPEMARRFGLCTMAVRHHLTDLARDGLVRATSLRQGRGRPARVYSLTEAASALFPQRPGMLAIEVLEEVERISGRAAVVQGLEARAERLLAGYRVALDGKPLGERVRILAALRDGEGYLCREEGAGGGPREGPDLVEHHCPIAEIARRWPEVCRIEADTFRRALHVPVERVEHILSGDGACRYKIGRKG